MKKRSMTGLGRPSLSTYKVMQKMPVCLLLHQVRSLHNVGAAFRTADAFGIEKIYLCGITGKPPHREIHKTALGATESVCWEYVEHAHELIPVLKKEGYTIVAVEQTVESICLQRVDPLPHAKYCLIFGNEVEGISDDILNMADMAVEIPQSGTKHSLNVAVCLGIVVWDFYKKTGWISHDEKLCVSQ